MPPLVIQSSVNSPSINFDNITGYLIISGRSIPEHVIEFYQPLEDWINNYLETFPKKITVDIKLDYLNTHSTSRLLVFLRIIEKYHCANDDAEIMITWFFDEDDEDMKELGEEINSLLNAPFEIKEY